MSDQTQTIPLREILEGVADTIDAIESAHTAQLAQALIDAEALHHREMADAVAEVTAHFEEKVATREEAYAALETDRAADATRHTAELADVTARITDADLGPIELRYCSTCGLPFPEWQRREAPSPCPSCQIAALMAAKAVELPAPDAVRHDVPVETQAAAFAYEIYRLYAAQRGEALAPWADAPGWQQNWFGAIVGEVRDNPNADAALVHDAWVASCKADGWRYGHVLDPFRKTHPSLLPFGNLSTPERQRVRITIAIADAIITSG